MPDSLASVVVAGHVCVDVTPAIEGVPRRLAELLTPGALVNVGPAAFSAGGVVSNAGLALHRLGVPTRLAGMVGDDLFGAALRDLLEGHGAGLARGMIVRAGVSTSYSVVVAPPGVDRVFLHCPGANDVYGADDLPDEVLAGAKVLHFGYPPLMRRMFADEGRELERLLRRVRERGLVTSLDMAWVDPTSEAGRVDWRAILARCLPHLDVFVPSYPEMLMMLHGADVAEAKRPPTGAEVRAIAREVLALGGALVGLKLGERGFYVLTSDKAARLGGVAGLTGLSVASWCGRELYAPCFEVQVAGTTGCGDCTAAGFLAGLVHGLDPEAAVTAAVAVGACSVERDDPVSGIPAWADVQKRIAAGWRRRAGLAL